MTPEQQQSLIEMELLLELTLQQACNSTQKISHLADEVHHVTTELEDITSPTEVVMKEVDCLTEQIEEATDMFVNSISVIQEMQAKVNRLRKQQE